MIIQTSSTVSHPWARHVGSGEIVTVGNAPPDADFTCIHAGCGAKVTPVRPVMDISPHFRHEPGAPCVRWASETRRACDGPGTITGQQRAQVTELVTDYLLRKYRATGRQVEVEQNYLESTYRSDITVFSLLPSTAVGRIHLELYYAAKFSEEKRKWITYQHDNPLERIYHLDLRHMLRIETYRRLVGMAEDLDNPQAYANYLATMVERATASRVWDARVNRHKRERSEAEQRARRWQKNNGGFPMHTFHLSDPNTFATRTVCVSLNGLQPRGYRISVWRAGRIDDKNFVYLGAQSGVRDVQSAAAWLEAVAERFPHKLVEWAGFTTQEN